MPLCLTFSPRCECPVQPRGSTTRVVSTNGLAASRHLVAMSTPAPPLPMLLAHTLAGFCAASYVGVLYISQSTRISYASQSTTEQAKERQRRRNDPDVIRARMTAAALSVGVSCALVVGVVRYLSHTQVCQIPYGYLRTMHHEFRR